MAQVVDTLYTDLELRTQKFDPQVRAAGQQIDAISRQLDTKLPNASVVASKAVADWSEGFKRQSDDLKEKMRRAIDATIYKLEQLSEALDRNDKKATDALRKRAEASKERFKDFANNDQLAGFQAVLDGLTPKLGATANAADDLGRRGERATLAMASGIETMARVGTEGLGSLKGGISSLAAALGSGGILAGALVYATTAVIEYFARAKAESEKAKRKIIDDLQETYRAQQRDRDPISAARLEQSAATAEIDRLTIAINKQVAAYRSLTLSADAAAKSGDDVAAASLRATAAAADRKQLELGRELLRVQEGLTAAKKIESDATEGLKDAEAQRYGALLRGQQLTRGEQEQANRLLARYRAELAATTGIDRDAQEKRIALLGRIAALSGETVKQSERREATEARSDEQLALAKKNLVDQFEDLIAATKRGDVTFVEYERRLRDLNDAGDALSGRLRAAKEDTSGLAADLQGLGARATEAGTALRGIEAQRLAERFEQMAVSITATRVDDLAFGMKQFRAEVERLKGQGAAIDPDDVARVIALQEQLLENTRQEEAADERIRAILKGKISDFDAQLALQSELTGLRAQEAALAGTDEVTQLRRAELRALIAKYEAEIAKLTGDTAAKGKALVAHSESVADLFEKSLASAFGIATAILGADNATTKLIGGLSTVAGGFRDIVRLANEAAAKAKLIDPSSSASGLSALFGSTGGLASALPAIGAIVGGLGALGAFGGRTDPAAEQRRKEHEENLAALRAIEKHTGDLVNVRASGRELTTIEEALGRLLGRGDVQFIESQQTGRRQKLAQQAVASGFSATSLEGLSKSTGLSVKELQEIAASMGITLNGTVASLRAFQEALLNADLSAFVDGFAGQLRRLEIEARLDPKAFEGIAGIIKRLQVLAGPDGAPAIAKALEGLDLSTSGGREEAVARLVALMKNLEGLTKADLGGLNISQFVQEILDAIDALRAAEPKAKSAAEAFTEQLEAIGIAFEFGSITLEQRLDRTKAAIAKLFPELADSLDFSSADALQASIQRMIEGFTADGIVTEAEAEQIAALRALKAALDASAAATLDAEEAAKRKAEAEKEAAEQAEEEARRRADEAKEAAQRELEARRRRIFRLADAKIDALDIDDPVEQLKVRLAAVIEAFPELTDELAQFDLATQEGRDALEAYLEGLIGSSADLQSLADQLGIPLEDLLAVLLELEGGADAATQQLRTLADELEQAFADVDFSVALEGITDPVERLVRIAKAAGGADARIKAALEGLDLTTEGGRRNAESLLVALGKSVNGSGADDAALRDAILRILQEIRDVPPADLPGGDAEGPAGAELGRSRGARSETASVAVLAEDVRFSRLLDIEGQQVALLGDIRSLLGGGRLVSPPSLPSGFGAPVSAGAAGAVSITVINQVNNTPTQSTQELTDAVTTGTTRGIETALGRSLTARRALAGRSELTT